MKDVMSRAMGITGPLRRLLLTILVLVGTAAAVRLLASVLATDGLSIPEVGILILFALTFAWIAMSFWTAIAGFLLHVFGLRSLVRAGQLEEPPEGPIEGRTALAVPIYHEEPEAVGRRLAAIYRSLQATGQENAFDIFILSDSRDDDVVFEEQTMWAELCAELQAKERIFYRNRDDNAGRKAGNIAEFCRRWGKRYDYFLCLDADSLMIGDTLVYLARLMDVNPKGRAHSDVAAADRRQDPVRAHPAVRLRPLQPAVRARHRLLVSRTQQLLGPQRHHPHRSLHGRCGSAQAAGQAAARRRDSFT